MVVGHHLRGAKPGHSAVNMDLMSTGSQARWEQRPGPRDAPDQRGRYEHGFLSPWSSDSSSFRSEIRYGGWAGARAELDDLITP